MHATLHGQKVIDVTSRRQGRSDVDADESKRHCFERIAAQHWILHRPIKGFGLKLDLISPSATGSQHSMGSVIAQDYPLELVSQEHGILTKTNAPAFLSDGETETLKIGEQVQIIGQHACLIFAAHPWLELFDPDFIRGPY